MSPISPSASFLLPINRRGSFFEDVFFQDAREDFHHAVQDVLSRRDRVRGGNRSRDLSCYRKLQEEEDDFDEDNQALTITEDDSNRKILLDLKEFHPNGDVKVHAVTDRELLVEGSQHDRKTGRAFSFSKTFMLPWYADLSCGYFSVDISSDGILRIITTKKAESTGRSIPLVVECEAITEDEFNDDSFVSSNNNNSRSRSFSSNRKVSMSTNGFQNEAYDYTNGSTVNSNTESVHCDSQEDTSREVPMSSKRGKIIPVVFVKNETSKESNKVSQNSSSNHESDTYTNQNGSSQYSSNSRNSSSSPSSKNRLIKTVITTTFDVKSNSNESIPAKQQEIVIPIKIEPKTSAQQKNYEKVTKQYQPNSNTTVPNENSSDSNSSKQHEKVIPIRIEPKSSGHQQTNSKKVNKQQQSNRKTTGTNAKSSFPIPNLVNTQQKNEKQRSYPREFVIPLTIEGESSDEVPFQKEAVKKVEIGRQDQNKKSNGKKPPINLKNRPQSPTPKKLIISSVFKGQEEQEKEMKRGVSPINKPPIPRNERSSSIEDRVSVFTRMSPVAERKSRRDVMDEIRGNSRPGARSRSRSIEELVSKFDKMNPQIEKGVLTRKNSREREEKNEIVEKKPIVKRKESIIPIKLEYEENDDNSFASIISEVSSSINAMTNQINEAHTISDAPLKADGKENINGGLASSDLNLSNVNDTEQVSTFTSHPRKQSITENISYSFSPSCISNDSTSKKYTKDDNSVVSTDEENPKKSKDKTKKSSKKKMSRKQSIPGVQVSDDETGETTLLVSGRSRSAAGRNKKNVDSPIGSLGDESNGSNSSQSSLLSTAVKASNETEKTTNSSTGFSGENIFNTRDSSDEIIKETCSNLPEVKDQTNISEANGTNSSNSLLQREQSNTSNLINSMSDSPLSKVDSNGKKIATKIVHDYSNLRDLSNERSRKGKAYKRTYVNNLVSDDSESDGGNVSCSPHRSRSGFRESRASVRLSSKNRTDESPVKQYIDNLLGSRGNEIKKLNSEVLSECTSLEIPDENVPPEEKLAENIESKKSVEASNEKIESRRSSVLPSPSDLLKIKLPKKNKKEKSETSESSQNCNAQSNESENAESNVKSLNESRRASILPNPADLLKIKPPKKNKKENTSINESTCQNDEIESSKNKITDVNAKHINDCRRVSGLPDLDDLVKIKPPKKSSNEPNASPKKSISSENSENSKSSQDIQKPKEEPSTESKQQQNQTESQQIKNSKNTEKLDTKDNIITEKVTDDKVIEKIPENSLNPEATNNSENSTANLELPQTPSLRRKTSFKKFKVFENKRTPSPSPIRRPETLTSPKPEHILINKIEESSTPKKEETTKKKEDKPLIKDEPSPSTKNSKRNTCVTIENKDMFFSDPFFKDHRQLFMGGVREALKRSGITSMRNKLQVYRNLRLEGQTEDNQAICSAEDETSYKAVLDMTEFMEGEIKVKTMSSTEIVIEGISKAGNKSTPFTHSLPFPDSINMEGVEASLSEDGILAINAPKTNPDTED